MKAIKLLLFALLMMFSASNYAQNSNGHMKFMGIEINGKATDFANKLKQKGFTYVKSRESGIIMKGSFSGQQVDLFLIFSKYSKTIWKVVVNYPQVNSWNRIKNDYGKLQSQIINKYGNPTHDYHYFSEPYYEGDGYEMQAVRREKCNYATFWFMENGSIGLSISEYEQIKISYEDKENFEKNEEENEQRVMNDI